MSWLVAMAFVSVSAQGVSRAEADLVAFRFVNEKYINMSKAPVSVNFVETISDENMTYLYHYDIDSVGFVFVAASKSVPAVLAYSLDENFEMIPPVRDLFHLYKQEIRYAENAKLAPTEKAASQWAHYLSDNFTPKVLKGGVNEYLLTTRWNQNMYYNTYCPWDVSAGPYYDYRVPNGCVALACAQIMNYHHYPKSGQGASSYIPMGYPRQTVFFGQHEYHWDAMCDEPTSYANEIAKLAYHIGVSIQMNYTADGSGANTDNAKRRFYETFKYDPEITSYYRGSYIDTTVTQYIQVLKNEIDNKRPVYYAGCTQTYSSCHAYVLDGYDSDDNFHLNFGWGGASNAYYAMDNFTSGWQHWDYGGECIANIMPARAAEAPSCQGLRRQTASFGYITDGSHTIKPYQANPDCSWMIATPGATSYRFNFDRLDLNPDVDYITIYNGPTIESGVKASFTGTTPPTGAIVVNADSVLITFTSTGNGPDVNSDYYGFLIQYSTTLSSSTCNQITNVYDWTAEITDGSNDGENYHPQSNCTWIVSHNYISGYSISFPEFDLGYGDFVDVYNATTTPPTLYKRYDIYNPPHGIDYVTFSKMRVNFVSDNWDQKDGFKLRYWALAGVDNYSGIEDMSVYPNPSSDILFVNFTLNESEKVYFKLFDMAGKQVLMDVFEAENGENHQTVDVSNLNAGLYLMEMTTTTGRVIQKVLVQ